MKINVMRLKAFAFFPWICGLVLDLVPLEECEVREMRHYLCMYLSCSMKSLESHLVRHLTANKTLNMQHRIPLSGARICFLNKQNGI